MLKTILILLIIYYLIKFLMRFVAPFFVKKMVNKVVKNANDKYQQKEPEVKVGETVIDKKPNSTQQSTKNVGEYIEFEEID